MKSLETYQFDKEKKRQRQRLGDRRTVKGRRGAGVEAEMVTEAKRRQEVKKCENTRTKVLTATRPS